MNGLLTLSKRRSVMAVLLFAVILTATGAFGTFRIVLPVRLAFWIVAVGAGSTFLSLTMHLLLPRVGSRWLCGGITVFVAAVPTAIFVTGLSLLYLPAPAIAERALFIYPPTVLLSLLFLLVARLAAEKRIEVPVEAEPRPDDRVPPLIASKLSPRMARSSLIAVEAQDHYLRVVTRDGEALVHMRFGDALAALADSDGAQVHRSWWVARQSIEHARWMAGRGELELADGHRVPVSRAFAARAKALARQPAA